MNLGREQVDMSQAALARRHEDMRQLYKLMMYLRHARYVGPVEPRAVDPDAVSDRRTRGSGR